jgi:hypothetical protein
MNRLRQIEYLSSALIVLALVDFLISAKYSSFRPGDNLGIFSGLSYWFYLSLILLSLSSWLFSRLKPNSLFSLFLILLAQCIFTSVGFLVGGLGALQPDFLDPVYHFSATAYMDQTSLFTLISHSAQYGYWPASNLFHGVLFEVTGTYKESNLVSILLLARVLYAAFQTTMLFAFLKRMTRNIELSTIGSLIFIMYGAYEPAVLKDVGYNFAVFLVIIYFLNKRPLNQLALVPLIFVALISNAWGSIMLLAILTAFAIMTKNFRLIILPGLIFAVWNVIFLGHSVTGFITSELSHFFFVPALHNILSASTAVGSSIHQEFTRITLYYAAALYILAIICISITLVQKTNVSKRMTVNLLMVLFALLLADAAFGTGFGPNPIESIERTFTYSIPFLLLPILLSLMGIRRRLLIYFWLLLLICSPLTIITSYGGVSSTFMSTPEQMGGQFAQTFATNPRLVALWVPFYGNQVTGNMFLTNGSFVLNLLISVINVSTVGLPSTPARLAIGQLNDYVRNQYAIYTASTNIYWQDHTDISKVTDIIYSNSGTCLFITR